MGTMLGHPITGREYPVQADPIGTGGTGVGGLDRLAVPTSDYGWTGLIWVPKSVTAAGYTNIAAPLGIEETWSRGIFDAVRNLFSELSEQHVTIRGASMEVRKLSEAGSAALAMRTPIDARRVASGTAVTGRALPQGLPTLQDLSSVAFDVNRKYVGTDAGAYVSPVGAAAVDALTSAVTFTGVNLAGRVYLLFSVTDQTYHLVTSAVDPVPPAVGTLTVAPAIASANAVLRIPYRDVPHAYSTPTDAIRTEPITASPPAVNGPAVLLSNAALTEAGAPTSYSLPAFVANYDLYTVWISWTGAGDDTYQWDIRARIDDQAAGDWIVSNGWWNVLGTALGAPAVTGLSGCRISTRTKLREIDVYRTKLQVGLDLDAVNVRVWITLGR